MVKDDPSIIAPTLKHLKASFRSGKTLDLEFRKQQLRNLKGGLIELSEKFHIALQKDLGISKIFSMMCNVESTSNLIQITLDSLSDWAKPVPVDTPLLMAPAKSYLSPEPLGVALCMGTWNYPIITLIPYVAAAIAAGNCVVTKPSEVSPNSSAVFAELFKYLDSDCYRCIEGEFQVASEIIKQPFDVIVFTGSSEKGKLVAKAAAENLTPTIMELGGKCPTIVNREADLDNAAMRISRARFVNAGQTCLACDYVYVHKDVKERFISLMKEKLLQFYGEDASKATDYSRIINVNHTKRIKSYLDEDHGGKVLFGGQVKVDEKYVAPTLVENPRHDSKMMKDEIFGPILPIYEFSNIEEVVEFINNGTKPLAAYYYGSPKSEDFKQVRLRVSSGALACNESFFQLVNYHLPFGGVGESGTGKLSGYSAFKSLSHFKSVLEANTNNSFPNSAFFPPYTKTTETLVKNSFKYLWVTQDHAWKVIKVFLLFFFLLLLYKNFATVLGAVEGSKQIFTAGRSGDL